MKREAVVLAVLLIGGLCCPHDSAAPALSRHARSISSTSAFGALLASPGAVKEVEEGADKRHLKPPSPYGDYLFWLRSGECPDVEEGTRGFFCPTPDADGTWRCVTEYQLCDHMRDCPNAEDEHPTHCLFYSVVQTHFSKLTRSLLLRSIITKHNNHI